MIEKFIFESQIFIRLDYSRWYENVVNYSVEQIYHAAMEQGFDIEYEYKQYRNEEIDEDAFLDTLWEYVKDSRNSEPMQYTAIEPADFEEDMIDDFNQSKLEQYYDFPGVESIRATEVTDDGKFVVEVEAVADLDVESMKSYLTGQYSDGWGEGFEQTEFSIRSNVGPILFYVSTWSNRQFEIKLVS